MSDNNHSHHHVIPYKTFILVWVGLIILTGVTVGIAQVDLGRFNFTVAMAVATLKAFLVCAWFMHLKYDKKENTVIFVTSLVFLFIFFGLTFVDLFSRGNVYTKGQYAMKLKEIKTEGKSKFANAWIATPELVAHGKEIFSVQCTSCHGAEGKGDGPAAAALNPVPRNFHSGKGWTNGRKPSQVMKTLIEGIAGTGMASYGTLSEDDRWGLVHYVLSLGPKPGKDTVADLKKIGVDPSGKSAGKKKARSLPVDFVIDRMAK